MLKLLRASECAYTDLAQRNASSAGRLAGFLLPHLLLPYGLLHRTAVGMLRQFLRSGLAVAMVVVLLFLMSAVNFVPEMSAWPAFVGWFCTTLALTIFATPSLSSSAWFDLSMFAQAYNVSAELKALPQPYLDLVSKCLQSHREETNKRLGTLTWFLGSLWALFLYLLSKLIDGSAGSDATGTLVAFVACVLTAALVQCYRSGTTAVYVLAEAVAQQISYEKLETKT